MANKIQWFKFFPVDWETDEDIQLMTLEERGIYITLLVRSWIQGSIPKCPSKALSLLKQTQSFATPLLEQNPNLLEQGSNKSISDGVIKVLKMFQDHPDQAERLIHWKLEDQRRKIESLTESRANAGKKGGFSKALAKRKQTSSKAKAKPEFCQVESELELDSLNNNNNNRVRDVETFAEAPSLESALRFGETQMIPAAMVEKWHGNSELNQWACLANGKHWSKNLLAYWKSIPPADQRKWRDIPANGQSKNKCLAEKTSRPKPEIHPIDIEDVIGEPKTITEE